MCSLKMLHCPGKCCALQAAADQQYLIFERNSKSTEFKLAEAACKQRIRKCRAQANSDSLQDAKAGFGTEHWTADRFTDVGDQGRVERLWQTYFKDRTQWWDNRNNKLHSKSPDFRHRSTKEALWVDSWNTPQWVTEALAEMGEADGGRSESRYGKGRISNAVDLRSPQQDDSYWTALILKHTKSGNGRQAFRVYKEMRDAGIQPSSYTFVAILKACSRLQDLESARQTHAEVVQSGLEADVYVGTTLVDVYGRCGSLLEARSVFEKMPHRSVVSWNAMISAYAQKEHGDKALHLYTRMQQEGVVPDDRTFVSVLKGCSSLIAMQKANEGDGTFMKKRCFEQAKIIHGDIMASQFESDKFVGTMLVDVYARCGSLVDARTVFERMPQRDVVSWNAMILGYAQMQQGEEALHLYTRMKQEGITWDNRTFVGALKACSSLAASEIENEADAILVKNSCLERARAIHLDLVKSGYEVDVFVATMLVDVFSKCGSLVDARCVFEEMPYRDVVSWNAMLLGYAQVEKFEEALDLYARMEDEGVVPNDQTFIGALKAWSGLAASKSMSETDGISVKTKCLEQVRTIHLDLVKGRYESSVFVGTMLVDAYAKCGNLGDARRVFEGMLHRDVAAWNAMILGYAQMEESEEALRLYAEMLQAGLVPTDRTFVSALKACSSMVAAEDENEADRIPVRERCLEQVNAILSQIVQSGSKLELHVANMLVDVYAKCGNLVDARLIFEKLSHRNVVSWNAMILGYAQMGEGEEALRLYSRMQQEGVVPDDRTFVGALKACGVVAGLDRGKEIHAQISKYGHEAAGLFLRTSLIDMYGKCGCMVDAQKVFDSIHTRDSVTWSALMSGYARQGENEAVFNLFERMRQEGIQPNGITFLSVITACSHMGLVDKGQKYFEAMTRDFDISPTIEHYTCMVDLLGRAGHLDHAMEMVKQMPLQPDAAIWETILGACQKWGNVELGRRTFECAVKLDKNHAAAYVLMSNIYADAQKWEDAENLQAIRLETQAWKQPGQSWWTDFGGNMHQFVVGDQEHFAMIHIYTKLRDVFGKMKDGHTLYTTTLVPHASDNYTLY